MRSLSKLTIVALATLTVGGAAAYAQSTAQQPSTCGIETWSTDQQTYVTVPCNNTDQAKAPTGKPGTAANGQPCGIETWSTDQQTYVTTPCVGGTTYENPNGASQ
jgi:hypothetical protein